MKHRDITGHGIDGVLALVEFWFVEFQEVLRVFSL
jgi:hypothetical protein